MVNKCVKKGFERYLDRSKRKTGKRNYFLEKIDEGVRSKTGERNQCSSVCNSSYQDEMNIDNPLKIGYL